MTTAVSRLRRIAQGVGRTPPLVVLAIAWALVIVYAFPGLMTRDSFDHLREAREHNYTDWHPAAINALWKVCDYIVAGPFGMLVLQTTLFLVGLYLLLRRTFEPRPAAWIAAGVFVFPPISMTMVVIWKDALMIGFLTIGVAGIMARRTWPRILGLVALTAATAVRYNAFAATLPLIVLLFELPAAAAPATRLGRWLRRYVLAAAAWLATVVAAFSFNAAITDHEMHPWHSTLALFDVIGTLAYVEDDLPDAELERLFAGTDLLIHTNIHNAFRLLYKPSDFLPIIMNDKRQIPWDMPINGYVPAPQAQRDALTRAFKATIARYPIEYVKHRLSVMAEVLWITSSYRSYAVIPRKVVYLDYAKSIGLSTGWSRLQEKMTRWTRFVAIWTPIFLPWIYALLSLVLLPFAWRQRDLLALCTSGLVLESSLLPLAVSPDYRYSHWMVLCAVLTSIILGARRARRRELARTAQGHPTETSAGRSDSF